MKTLSILAAAFAFTLAGAHARLGETADQLRERYGAGAVIADPRDGRLGTMKFSSMGFEIVVALLDGKSQCEIFTRTDRGAMSDQETAAILAANAFGAKWEPVSEAAIDRRWRLGEAAVAVLALDLPPALSVMTKGWVDFNAAKKADALKGL